MKTNLKSLSGSVLFLEEQLEMVSSYLDSSINKKIKSIPISPDLLEFSSKLTTSKMLLDELINQIRQFRGICEQGVDDPSLHNNLQKAKYTIEALTIISRFLLLHTLGVSTSLKKKYLDQPALQIVLLQTDLLSKSWTSFTQKV